MRWVIAPIGEFTDRENNSWRGIVNRPGGEVAERAQFHQSDEESINAGR
jgi:hypothetical protein